MESNKTLRNPVFNEHGFTIIEMMIAMTILSFIAMAVYQNTTQSFVVRDNVEQEGDFYNSVRVVLDSLGRDIAHMYSPHQNALPGSIRTKPDASPQPGMPAPKASTSFQPIPISQYWGESKNPEGVRLSRLQGDTDKISFIANNHMRLFRDTSESDFAKLSYTLADEKIIDQQTRGKILRKREDFAAFEDTEQLRDSESATEVDLLSGIKTLKFRYLDGEKDQWSDRWDTTGMDHKDVFPAVVEVTLEVYMPKRNTPGGSLDNDRPTFKVTQRFKPEAVQ